MGVSTPGEQLQQPFRTLFASRWIPLSQVSPAHPLLLLTESSFWPMSALRPLRCEDWCIKLLSANGFPHMTADASHD